MMDFPGCIRLLAKLQSCRACQVSEFINEIPQTLRQISVLSRGILWRNQLDGPAKCLSLHRPRIVARTGRLPDILL
jgi:hypothetical protein